MTVKTSSKKIRIIRQEEGSLAFTMVELLAVIAIFGILIALLIPGVGKLRKSVQASHCASNLRQIQMANIAHAQDNDGKYVRIMFRTENGGQARWLKDLEFLAYLKRDSSTQTLVKELWCPTALFDPERTNSEPYTYGVNINGFSTSGSNEPGYTRQIRVTDIPHPAKSMAFADALDWQISEGGVDIYDGREIYQARAVAYRHSNKANVVFYDAHVELLPKSAFEKINGKTAPIWKIQN